MIRKRVLLIVILLDLFITFLAQTLGCLMYMSNSKSIMNNMAFVDVTGTIDNIKYGLHFGKSVESYYGMENLLKTVAEGAEQVDDLFIVTDEAVLFSTDAEDTLDPSILSLSAGSNQLKRDRFYCAFALTDEARLVTRAEVADVTDEWNAYFLKMILFAASGFLVTVGLIYLTRMIFKNRPSIGYKVAMAIIIVWVFDLGVGVGVGAYREYMASIDGMTAEIERVVRADFDRIYAQGITDDEINGTEEYFARFSESIPEVDMIAYSASQNIFLIQTSDSYFRKVRMDYVIQTALLLAFSIMVLAEYQLFMNGINKQEKES